jgi:hypothetical protein
LVAVTVSVAELPAVIEAGLAAIVTVGVALVGAVELRLELPPHPLSAISNGSNTARAQGDAILEKERLATVFMAALTQHSVLRIWIAFETGIERRQPSLSFGSCRGCRWCYRLNRS